MRPTSLYLAFLSVINKGKVITSSNWLMDTWEWSQDLFFFYFRGKNYLWNLTVILIHWGELYFWHRVFDIQTFITGIRIPTKARVQCWHQYYSVGISCPLLYSWSPIRTGGCHLPLQTVLAREMFLSLPDVSTKECFWPMVFCPS